MQPEHLPSLNFDLSRVQIPNSENRIYKHECCVSFDTPRSEGGLFIDLNTFAAFGKDFVDWNYEKTGNPVYLHIKETKKIDPEHRPSKRPNPQESELGVINNEVEYEETYKVVILPGYVSLPFPSAALPDKVNAAVDAILQAESAEGKDQVGAWTADYTEMTVAEIENAKFDLNRIQESGQKLTPIFGDRYTGLVNIGNSCYMATTLQVLFSTRPFIKRYLDDQSLKEAFEVSLADPTVDLNMQLTKLAYGLLSPEYSAEKQGIRPHMFKGVIAASDPKFSSVQQQDALEFFLHFLDRVKRANAGKTKLEDPASSFKFGIEDIFECDGKFTSKRRHAYVLSLNIPLPKATNKEEVASFAEKLANKDKEGVDEIVRPRPRVPLRACLANFCAPEEVHDFYNPDLKTKMTAKKTSRLTSYPKYLVLHMRRFFTEVAYEPKKLDIHIEIPDIINISHLRRKRGALKDKLLPDVGTDGVPDKEETISVLVAMGYNRLHCQKAVKNTSNVGVDDALNWLLSHKDDPDIDAPISESQSDDSETSTNVDSPVTSQYGFSSEGEREDEEYLECTKRINEEELFEGWDRPSDIPRGIYRLIGVISHGGPSTELGHYVAHVLKDDKWVIFNDEKVAVSLNPPKEMGYLFFCERLENHEDTFVHKREKLCDDFDWCAYAFS